MTINSTEEDKILTFAPGFTNPITLNVLSYL
jgi:hypothetical protein